MIVGREDTVILRSRTVSSTEQKRGLLAGVKKHDEVEKLGLFEVVATREEHGHLHGHPLATTANS